MQSRLPLDDALELAVGFGTGHALLLCRTTFCRTTFDRAFCSPRQRSLTSQKLVMARRGRSPRPGHPGYPRVRARMTLQLRSHSTPRRYLKVASANSSPRQCGTNLRAMTDLNLGSPPSPLLRSSAPPRAHSCWVFVQSPAISNMVTGV